MEDKTDNATSILLFEKVRNLEKAALGAQFGLFTYDIKNKFDEIKNLGHEQPIMQQVEQQPLENSHYISPLDAINWCKIFEDGEAITIKVEVPIDIYAPEPVEDILIAETIIDKIIYNLSYRSFDLNKTKSVVVLFVANKEVWGKIPTVAIEYSKRVVDEYCVDQKNIFYGKYVSDEMKPVMNVCCIFNGSDLSQ